VVHDIRNKVIANSLNLQKQSIVSNYKLQATNKDRDRRQGERERETDRDRRQRERAYMVRTNKVILTTEDRTKRINTNNLQIDSIAQVSDT
jgi:hypothetical protein